MGMMDAVIRPFIRKAAGAVDLCMTEWEALRVTQHELPMQEEARAGLAYYFGPKNGITGIAPVQAVPTTAAQWVLWNADQVKSVIIDELGMLLVSGTAGSGIICLASLIQTPSQDAVAMNTGMGVWAANGGGGGGASFNSVLRIVSGVTLTQPAAPYWFPIAEAQSGATAILSTMAMNRQIKGGLIIPPKTGLALAVTSPAGTSPLFAPCGRHVEKVLTLE